MIAHRPETIRSADKIVLLNNGTLSEVTAEQLFGQTEKTKEMEITHV